MLMETLTFFFLPHFFLCDNDDDAAGLTTVAIPYCTNCSMGHCTLCASTLVDNCQDPKSFMDAYDRSTGRYEAGSRVDMREDLGGPNSGGPRGSLGGNPRGRWGPADRRGADDYPTKRRRY